MPRGLNNATAQARLAVASRRSGPARLTNLIDRARLAQWAKDDGDCVAGPSRDKVCREALLGSDCLPHIGWVSPDANQYRPTRKLCCVLIDHSAVGLPSGRLLFWGPDVVSSPEPQEI